MGSNIRSHDPKSAATQAPLSVTGTPTGPSGPTGGTGPTGPSGPSGPTGGTGPSGPSGPTLSTLDITASIADLTLTAGVTAVPDVPELTVTYNFGDTATETHPVADPVTHTYAAAGDYTVTADAVPVAGYDVSGATETVTVTEPSGPTVLAVLGTGPLGPQNPIGPAGPAVVGQRVHRRRVRTNQRPAQPPTT